ncbi:MAG: hypothetical protein ACOCUT_00050 [bacterium]
MKELRNYYREHALAQQLSDEKLRELANEELAVEKKVKEEAEKKIEKLKKAIHNSKK